MAAGADLSFVNLGITIDHMVKSFNIGSFSVAFYGLIIAIGMMCGILMAQADGKRRGQDPEIYLDFAIYGILFAILGSSLKKLYSGFKISFFISIILNLLLHLL